MLQQFPISRLLQSVANGPQSIAPTLPKGERPKGGTTAIFGVEQRNSRGAKRNLGPKVGAFGPLTAGETRRESTKRVHKVANFSGVG